MLSLVVSLAVCVSLRTNVAKISHEAWPLRMARFRGRGIADSGLLSREKNPTACSVALTKRAQVYIEMDSEFIAHSLQLCRETETWESRFLN